MEARQSTQSATESLHRRHDSLYDVIVVGGSAAGLTAAIYTARQGLRTLLITKDIGGQMLLTNEIENYPGFETIGGFELANKFREQAERYGTEFLYEEVVAISEETGCQAPCFQVKTASASHNATAVILAFGKTPKDLGVPGEQEFKGRGVSYCAVCDGPLFKGMVVAVVGSGDQGLEAANYLSGVVKTVHIIHNHDKPIGSEEMVQQVLSMPNVRSIPNSKVDSITGSGRVQNVTVSGTQSLVRSVLPVDGIFIEIGYIAKTDFLKDLVKLNAKKEVEIDKEGNTSRRGIFAAGDVTDTPYKQAVISASQGSTAALTAYNYIQKLRGKSAARADWRSIKPVAKST
jgi:thioredoxin reductase (NADPH)